MPELPRCRSPRTSIQMRARRDASRGGKRAKRASKAPDDESWAEIVPRGRDRRHGLPSARACGGHYARILSLSLSLYLWSGAQKRRVFENGSATKLKDLGRSLVIRSAEHPVRRLRGGGEGRNGAFPGARNIPRGYFIPSVRGRRQRRVRDTRSKCDSERRSLDPRADRVFSPRATRSRPSRAH